MAKGVFTNLEMIDSLISDLNNAEKYLFEGQIIAHCDGIAKIAQKITLLKHGIEKDIENRDETISKLKSQIEEMGAKVIDCKPEELDNVLK